VASLFDQMDIIWTIQTSAYFYRVLSLAGVLLETKEVKKIKKKHEELYVPINQQFMIVVL
jgi:hypothetical protein